MEKQIEIRRAEEKDIKKVMDLLSQVLEIHAKIRPDVFVSGTTKYTDAELLQMFEDDQNPVYVAVDEKDQVVGYAFCKLRQQPFSNNMVQFTSLFIDDLCVDTTIRGKHIGQKLFEHVKKEAVRLGCYEVTLNVWEGNDSAKAFYEKMGLNPKRNIRTNPNHIPYFITPDICFFQKKIRRHAYMQHCSRRYFVDSLTCSL